MGVLPSWNTLPMGVLPSWKHYLWECCHLGTHYLWERCHLETHYLWECCHLGTHYLWECCHLFVLCWILCSLLICFFTVSSYLTENMQPRCDSLTPREMSSTILFVNFNGHNTSMKKEFSCVNSVILNIMLHTIGWILYFYV